ncbi:MAG TPA: hypothetical protein PK079_23335 [Leptospiraceae bacterium]|nr:hypothetical protein [Leptospiraceae bacterium]HMW06540.1 hypothetical protein [Leptospiraceae bacterium]HMX35294.1 hypothetical protein [Leptospiraceae bacterium]HMY32822.1 hypothetical protein [Leptospiraceae bacterium]HMZ65317.1 hypothetical protein [Leptospiraceae bacterium]
MNLFQDYKDYFSELNDSFKKTKNGFEKIISNRTKSSKKEKIFSNSLARIERLVQLIEDDISDIEDVINSNMSVAKNQQLERALDEIDLFIESEKRKIYVYAEKANA